MAATVFVAGLAALLALAVSQRPTSLPSDAPEKNTVAPANADPMAAASGRPTADSPHAGGMTNAHPPIETAATSSAPPSVEADTKRDALTASANTADPAASAATSLSSTAGKTKSPRRRLPHVNRPLDFARLEAAFRLKYQLDQLEDPAREFDLLWQRAEAGDAEAEFALGLFLAYGDAKTSDPVLAAEMFTRAANAGVTRAQTELGRLHLTGDGVTADPARAEELFKAAWRAGDAEGAFALATGHRLGLFANSDPAQAVALLTAAAEQGHIAAARTLYALTTGGELTQADPRLPAWLQAAAETGDVSALLDLADLNLRAQDGEKAFAAFETAAEAGSTRALWKLLTLSPTSLVDPAARARVQEIFQLHTEKDGRGAVIAFEALAFLQMFESDRAAATVRAREYFQAAADRLSYRAKVAVQLLDRGSSLPDVMRELRGLSQEDAYIRAREVGQTTAPPTAPVDQIPQIRTMVRAIYPVELAMDKRAGEATVAFVVQADGSVTDVHAVSATHPAFAAAAEASVKQWTFSPGKKDGRLVNTRLQVPVLFQPDE